MTANRSRLACFRSACSRRSALLAVMICVLLALPVAAAPGAPPPGGGATVLPAGRPAFAPGELLIGWQPGQGPVPLPPGMLAGAAGQPARSLPLSRDQAGWQAAAGVLAAQAGRPVLDVQPAFGYALLSVPAGQERTEMARLAALPWVRYAEPNYLVYAAAIPNDPYFPQQWNMTRVAAPQAWNVTTGVGLVTVAVLDTGVDFGHADLAGRIRSGGVNYITPGSPPQDDAGHGTHVAGIIAANINNSLGVAGMAGKVMILPYKVLTAAETGKVADLATAIYAAISTSANAQIINISAGAPNLASGDDTTLHNAVTAARQAGVLVVAAAGNYGDAGNPLFYPAVYPEALAVAATDDGDGHPAYSGFQPYVGIAAPGGTAASPIVSTYWPNTYATLYGTSMATPMVSGAAALALSLYPTMSVDDLIFTLEHTGDKVGPYAYAGGRNDYYGYGRLNAWNALQPLRASTQQVSLVSDGATQQVMAHIMLQSYVDQPVSWSVTKLAGQAWLYAWPPAGSLSARGSTTLTVGAATCGTPAGAYDGVARVQLTSAPHTSLDITAHLQLVGGQYCASLPRLPR